MPVKSSEKFLPRIFKSPTLPKPVAGPTTSVTNYELLTRLARAKLVSFSFALHIKSYIFGADNFRFSPDCVVLGSGQKWENYSVVCREQTHANGYSFHSVARQFASVQISVGIGHGEIRVRFRFLCVMIKMRLNDYRSDTDSRCWTSVATQFFPSRRRQRFRWR